MAQQQPSLGELITLGSTLLGCIVGGLVVGFLLDRQFDTTPLFELVGIGLGIVSAVSIGYVHIRRYLR